MMQRLMENGFEAKRLSIQHRMHPQILSFPNTFYENRLTTSPDRETCNIPGLQPYALVDVSGHENMVGTSVENAHEATAAIDVARSLASTGLSVTIIAPYQAQVRRLQSFRSGIPIVTVDAYQGHECDAVVLSVTRTNDAGFWGDERRMTVALTRARHVLRVCIHAAKWANDTSILGGLVRDATTRGMVLSH